MVRRCQRGFGQQESEQDECRSKISPHDLLRASNDTVPPTSLDVGDGGQFSAVVTTDIGRYYRYKCMPPSEHHHDFPHILPENCAELTWGLDCRKAPGPSAAQCHVWKGHATASVGAGARRDAAESLGLTEERQRAHGRIPEAGATKPS